MKSYAETLRRLFANGLILSLCGCELRYPVAGVVPPGADHATLVMFDSKTPRILLHIDEQNRTLRCVTASAKPEQLGLGLVHTYDFNGALVDKKLLPIFRRGGWEEGITTWGGAVSPNGNGVAYLEHQYPTDRDACDLVFLSFDTGLRSVLVKKLAKRPQELRWLAWVDTNRLTVAKDSIGDDSQGRLMIIDAPRAQIILDLTCPGLSVFSVSHDRNYLAYWEAAERFSRQGSIRILDVQTLQHVASTESGNLDTFGRLEWNSEDDKIAYVMDKQLRTFSLATKQSQTLFTFGGPSDYCTDVALQGYQNGKLYYRAEDQKDHVDRLHCLDETTRTPSGFKNHPEGPFNAYICRDGTIIYYKLAQEPLY